MDITFNPGAGISLGMCLKECQNRDKIAPAGMVCGQDRHFLTPKVSKKRTYCDGCYHFSLYKPKEKKDARRSKTRRRDA